MRTLDQQIRYQKLELVSSQSLNVPNTIKSWGTGLSQVFQRVLGWFAPSHEPHIWSTTANDGQTCWHIYDPMYQQRLTMVSEEEVRIWLDERYNF